MPTAMGQNMVATTVLGRKAERTTEAPNQTRICCFIDVPIRQRVRREILLSNPVVVQAIQIRSLPKRRMTISVKYRAITWGLGIILKTAFTAIGRREVTAMWTGRKIHHSAIHTPVAIANAPCVPKTGINKSPVRKNPAGPESNFKFCLPMMSPLFRDFVHFLLYLL